MTAAPAEFQITLPDVYPAEQIPWDTIPSPAFVLDESRLRRNLSLISQVQAASGAQIIVAFKGFSMFSTFHWLREYGVTGATASSLNEAILAKQEMRGEVHVYAPAYADNEFPQLLELADHLSFNSFSQWERFKPQVEAARAAGKQVGIGIRINPEYAEVETDLYNPAGPFSRLGVTRSNFRPDLLNGVDGLHFHTLCEKDSDTLERTLEVVERNFGEFLPQMQWVNFGGGHLMTRAGYDTDRLIRLVRDFRQKWNVDVILEPGSAFGWQTGWLLSTVLDVVENGKKIALLDVSVSAHMPDVMEMPYRPNVLGAALPGELVHDYLLGGTTCLAGDVIDEYSFPNELKVGDRVIFDDMMHYTMVKTSFFNGVKHPDIGIWHQNGTYEIVREFGYDQFRAKLS
ncbi:carboxynorspermidine decarboxylase [Deinococcus detaillensis]|uniref:Carboxynorspermidine decarboxylase n=1 Tax=Deinococcus detaillensis TaxID=2592048 RepID=A0A553USB1_9DEIO|nr:carboxynorspermidine decarboxylase [Deinococcus detaillensis]TSA83108.1 carboxynorspermidine decarboxylase [Deinococcus detaillensis]